MNSLVTLVIPTHNRHHYLNRALDYLQTFNLKILVADSTATPYTPGSSHTAFEYFHLSGFSLTQKLAYVFEMVTTTYVIMCADDDFIILEGLQSCLNYLLAHPDYDAAGGNCICYKKESLRQKHIEFALIYDNMFNYSINQATGGDRLTAFFRCYRTIFYALHKSENLKSAFTAAKDQVTNLFLNEYITALLPIANGKYVELPVLLQIREFAADSDDKRTTNLDAIFTDDQFKKQYECLLTSQAGIMSQKLKLSETQCFELMDNAMRYYAKRLPGLRSDKKITPEKTIGNFVLQVPFLGKAAILKYRQLKVRKQLKKVIKTEADKKNLVHVEDFIRRYQNEIACS